MADCIQIIIAPEPTAQLIAKAWPELPRYRHSTGFSLFPVDAESIDKRIPLAVPLAPDGVEFKFLTGAFRLFLRSLSDDGELAYLETDYFGGAGGQGALVCRDGAEIMPPTWHSSGLIKRALKEIGVPRKLFSDRLDSIGLDEIHTNDDLLDLIAVQKAKKTE